jgi:hypothetical protein
MAKIETNLTQTPTPEPSPITPVQPGQVSTGQEPAKPTAKPASSFQTGTPGLPENLSYAPGAVRVGVLANRPGHKIGLNRPTNALALNLGPNPTTVKHLLDRVEEHLDDPSNPTAHDLALMNGAFNVVG